MSNPRIISGKARGIRLLPVPGDTTRPVTDRVKEALFNIISTDIVDSNFLDLFGGTGSIGIEALSRGARFCQFTELNSKAITIIRENLSRTKTMDFAKVLQIDALRFVASAQSQIFDYIYIAPPQYKSLWKTTLDLVDKNIRLLSEDGWVIVQIHPIEYEKVVLENLVEFDQRRYGSTLLVFFSHQP